MQRSFRSRIMAAGRCDPADVIGAKLLRSPTGRALHSRGPFVSVRARWPLPVLPGRHSSLMTDLTPLRVWCGIIFRGAPRSPVEYPPPDQSRAERETTPPQAPVAHFGENRQIGAHSAAGGGILRSCVGGNASCSQDTLATVSPAEDEDQRPLHSRNPSLTLSTLSQEESSAAAAAGPAPASQPAADAVRRSYNASVLGGGSLSSSNRDTPSPPPGKLVKGTRPTPTAQEPRRQHSDNCADDRHVAGHQPGYRDRICHDFLQTPGYSLWRLHEQGI
ncbi:hypothetical protein MTO96_036827 [Rhipicephalus appendiculatus]